MSGRSSLSIRSPWRSARVALATLAVAALATTGLIAPPATAAAPAPTLDDLVAAGALGVVSSDLDADGLSSTSAGHTDLAGTPAPAEAKFRTASTTKAFVATAMMQLVDRGAVRLDAPIDRYLRGELSYGKQVTVRQLLSHTSGFPTGALEAVVPVSAEGTLREQLEAAMTTGISSAELLEYADLVGPATRPGSTFAYSNINYTLAALVIEAVTGRPLAEVVQDGILTPLGLDDTSFPDGPDMTAPFLRGYLSPLMVGEPAGAEPVDVTRQTSWVFYGSGDLITTTADVARFFDALLSGGLVSQRSLTQMITPTALSGWYGLGLMIRPTPCGPVIGHDGNYAGYDAVAMHLDGRTVVTAASTAGTWPRTGDEYVAYLGLMQTQVAAELCPEVMDPTTAPQEQRRAANSAPTIIDPVTPLEHRLSGR